MSRRRRTTEEDDLEEIRKGFEMFDVDGTGIINPAELLEVMDSMNIKEKNPFIYEIIESLSSEREFRKQGGVKLEDLVNYVYNKVNDTETNVGIRQIFDVINDRDTDTVSMSTFHTLAKEYGDQLSEDEIRYLLEKTQMGGEDLTFDEFYTIMKGAVKDNSKINNSSFMNASRSSYRNNDVYVKKSSNSNTSSIKKNKVDNNKKVRTKKFIYQEKQDNNIQEQELNQPYEEQNIRKEIMIQNDEEEPKMIEEIITNKNIINQNDINDNEDNNSNYPPNKEEYEVEIRNEIQENNEPQSENNDNAPLNYSYRKKHIDYTPKYEKVVEKQVVDIDDNLTDNLNINENIENNGDKIFKERQTKVTNLPEGVRQIEITEKTENVKVRPYVRGRYRLSKKNDEKDNKEEDKKEESNSYYRIRRPRGSKQSSNTENEQVSVNKVEVQEKEVVIPKRYHRRYRDSKASANNEN